MAPWDKIASVWKNVQEVDLRPIRDAALEHTSLALVSQDPALLAEMAARLRIDPTAPETAPGIHTPLSTLSLDDAPQAAGADLTLVLVTATADLQAERALVREWSAAGRPVLVIVALEPGKGDPVPGYAGGWGAARVLPGGSWDGAFLEEHLAPAIVEMLPDRLLSLGRHFPGLRPALSSRLINDISFSNAAYAFSTGLAEIVPVLDVPLNIADILVLTKAQALLVYRLGLVLGLPTDWRYYLAEFGSVVGSGFLWRQAARSLVGLIPVVGILPKVAVAYAGTYVVGQVVLRWHRTGRHLSRKEIGQLYRQAFDRGKILAGNLAGRIPRPRLPRPRLPRRRRKTRALPSPAESIACPACQAPNDPDANFCKNCGEPLQSQASPETGDAA